MIISKLMKQNVKTDRLGLLFTSLVLVGFLLVGTVSAMESGPWSSETVDNLGKVGEYTSLALNAMDFPSISYYDRSNGDLKYAAWDGTSWKIETVDNSKKVGEYSSLALDASGNPRISYFDKKNGDLKYAAWDGTSWKIETVDNSKKVGEYSSLALDASGNPRISYFDKKDGDLKYAAWDGTSWKVETVDNSKKVGEFTSLALDANGNPRISYFDKKNGDLKYAAWDGTSWRLETVDSSKNVGEYSSLALDANGNPRISYFDKKNGDLKYAAWDGTLWKLETVDSSKKVGEYSSLALDTSGDPRISYFDGTNRNLKYATGSGPIPEAFSEVENLVIDNRIIEGTPHWIFIASGTKEKQALLDYIDKAAVSEKQKTEWTRFISKIWDNHPVRFDGSMGSPVLVPGKSSDTFTLTPDEDAIFQEIERYIAEDMENVQANEIGIKWFQQPTHEQFMKIALDDQDYPTDLESDAVRAAPQPDTWCYNNPVPFCQQYNHGFVPIGIALFPVPIIPPQIFGVGVAPDNFGTYASAAKSKFLSHDYENAFMNMGYASHFMTDLGNPYHTPMVQILPLEYVDIPYSQIIFPNSQMILNYKTLHDKYEEMVANHWGMFYNGNQDRYDISDPTFSAKVHGTYSWGVSYRLIYLCYWHYIINNRNFDFESNSAIVDITQNRVVESMKNTRGLVRYVTGGQYPMVTVTASAGPGGSISPSGAQTINYGVSPTFTIKPGSGYVVDQILVDNSPVTENPYTFPPVVADHTISASFTPASVSGPDWIWSRDGWGDWQHTATWSGNIVGPCSERGPVMVDGHGEHGANVNLNWGSASSSVWRTFTDPSGTGWNTITFEGLMSGSDVPYGRWMTIDVNGQQVFGGTASQTPPGNHQMFEITRSFPQSPTVIVKISNGQSPAWGPWFYMEFHSLKLTQGTALRMTDTEAPFVIPDGSGLVTNATAPQ